MPTYEYKCDSCGYNFEKIQSIKDEPLKICPKCNGKAKRLISAGGGFIFKGSGFYTTDYRSESYKKKEKEETKPKEQKTEVSKISSDKVVSTTDKKTRKKEEK